MMKTKYLSQVSAEKVAERSADVSKLRFFCMGKELKDELFIYSYDLVDDVVVQAMLRSR